LNIIFLKEVKQGFISLSVIALLLVFATNCRSNDKIVLVNQGRTSAKIIIPEAPTATEKKAASVLRDYLKKMTGQELPIVSEYKFDGTGTGIYIGRCEATPDGKDVDGNGFAVQTDEKHIYLYGKSGKGTLYSVYTFLDKYLYCKKPAGGEPAVVPSVSEIIIPGHLNDIQNPSFLFRQSYYPDSNDPEYLDWHHLQRFEDLWGLWGHSLFKIINPDEYFKSHPEYYALVNGERQATQLCLSNEEVFNRTVAYLKAARDKNSDAIYWCLGQMDNIAYCRCDRCKKADAEEGGPQGSLIRFVNRVAQQFPDLNFVTLAYAYTVHPPAKTKPGKNVYIMLSSIDADRTKDLANEPTAKDFRDILKSWNKITDRIFIWDYTTQFTNYLCPFPDYNHAFSNAAFFLKNGVKGIFFQGSGDDVSDMGSLNSYMQAAALWNPAQNEDSVKQEFLKAYFGAAAKPMGEYLAALTEQVSATKASINIYGNPINNRKDYLSPESIDRYSGYLDKAEALTEENPLHYKHVEQVRLGLEYVVLQQALAYGTEKFGYFEFDENNETYSVSPKWRQRIDRFYMKMHKNSIHSLGEVGPALDDYYQSWQQVFETGWAYNFAAEAKLSLAHPFSEDYPANGLQTLVDGLDGQLDFSYNWLLFYGNDFTLTLAFKAEKPVQQFTMNWLLDPRHYIFLPEKIQILASDDGVQYKIIAEKNLPGNADEEILESVFVEIPVSHTAKYYKVNAICPKKLPAYSVHPSKKPSIAVDEVWME